MYSPYVSYSISLGMYYAKTPQPYSILAFFVDTDSLFNFLYRLGYQGKEVVLGNDIPDSNPFMSTVEFIFISEG